MLQHLGLWVHWVCARVCACVCTCACVYVCICTLFILMQACVEAECCHLDVFLNQFSNLFFCDRAYHWTHSSQTQLDGSPSTSIADRCTTMSAYVVAYYVGAGDPDPDPYGANNKHFTHWVCSQPILLSSLGSKRAWANLHRWQRHRSPCNRKGATQVCVGVWVCGSYLFCWDASIQGVIELSDWMSSPPLLLSNGVTFSNMIVNR